MAAKNLIARVKQSSMIKTDNADFAREWVAAWNAHDVERIPILKQINDLEVR